MKPIHIFIAVYSFVIAVLLVAGIVGIIATSHIDGMFVVAALIVAALLFASSVGIFLGRGYGYWIGGDIYTAQIFFISTSIVKIYLVGPISFRLLCKIVGDDVRLLFAVNGGFSVELGFGLFTPTTETVFGMDFFAVALALILWREVDRRTHRARNPEDSGGPVEFVS